MLRNCNFVLIRVTRTFNKLRLISATAQKMTFSSFQPMSDVGFTSHLLSSKNNMSHDNSQVLSSFEELPIKFGVETSALMEVINAHPSLAQSSPLQWENCFQVLIYHGFSANDCLYMLAKYPPLLKLNTKHINHIMEVWRSSDMGEHYLLSLIRYCPQYLSITSHHVVMRIPVLKSFGTWRNVVLLLKGSPDIMFENWNDVKAKILFLENDMLIKKDFIVKCFALNRSLLFLKTRFIFLERCGKYIKPKEKDITSVASKNPSLNKIVSLSDEEFVKRLTGVTLEEFEVFKELYSEEMEGNGIVDLDSE